MVLEAAPSGRRGRQPDDGIAAIQTCLTMQMLFGMALRQTTGFVESLVGLIKLDWAVPNYSTLSRQKTGKVNILHRGAQGPLHLAIDSTGIKVDQTQPVKVLLPQPRHYSTCRDDDGVVLKRRKGPCFVMRRL